MSKIKSLSQLRQLAPWFDISDYEACNTYTPQKWADELDARGWDRFHAGAVRHLVPKYLPGALEAASTLFSDNSQHPERHGLAIHDFFFRDPKAPIAKSSILSGWDDELVTPAYPSSKVKKPDEASSKNMRYALDDLNDCRLTAHLEIDLTAPDSALVESFKKALSRYRDHFGCSNPSKSGTAASFNKLKAYKVLAYLDLAHWALAAGVTIKNNTLALALFNGEEGERFLSESVRPLAEAAIAPGFIYTLRQLDWPIT